MVDETVAQIMCNYCTEMKTVTVDCGYCSKCNQWVCGDCFNDGICLTCVVRDANTEQTNNVE